MSYQYHATLITNHLILSSCQTHVNSTFQPMQSSLISIFIHFILKIEYTKPNIQLTTQKHGRNSHGVKYRASLTQATGSRLGKTVNRGPCETHEFSLKRAFTRVSKNTPRPKVRFLA